MTPAEPPPRRATLLEGDRGTLVRRALAELPPGEDRLWLGGPHGNAPHANRIVGREFRALVVDPEQGVDGNRLGAALGALVGGGELIWLDAGAPAAPSVERFRRLLQSAASEGRGVRRRAPEHWTAAPLPEAPVRHDRALPMPGDQHGLVAQITRRLVDQPGILAVRADRGRGKSAALGLAAADALAALPGEATIAVTAAQPAGSATLLVHARARCAALGVDAGRLRFVEPGQLAEGRPLPTRLLVDEAATLSGSDLLRIARGVDHLVLATTEHGYEGTGQAFRLRLLPRLAALPDRELTEAQLQTPLRWPVGDPLERLAAELLLLDAEAVTPETCSGAPSHLPAALLARDERRLAAVHGLLREAHYQTRPSDFLRMLDDDALRVWQIGAPGAPCACALTIEEGGLPPGLAAAMVRGERRPRGQLGAGILAERLGLEAGARLRSVRVNRIAVHERCRRRGIGVALVAALRADAARRGVDLITSSFGATEETERFWRACGLRPLRFGARPERASGRRALFVAAGVSEAGNALVQEAAARFEAGP